MGKLDWDTGFEFGWQKGTGGSMQLHTNRGANFFSLLRNSIATTRPTAAEKLLAFLKKYLKLFCSQNRKSMKKIRTAHNFASPTLHYERSLWAAGAQHVAGVDEAGRGPLAGPVVAAAVIFPPEPHIPGVNDSKKLSPAQRELLYQLISSQALAIGVGIIGEETIDRINILQATYCAMKQAIASLEIAPVHVLVDGRPIPDLNIPQTAIIGGDGKCFSIAAASIIAKVTRDRLMLDYDRQYPQYGFAQHKGYPTRKHVQAIIEHGFCPIHRTSFKIKNRESYG